MRYIALYFICLIISFSSYANEWNKHYNLVNSDLKTIQKIKSKDLSLSIRYFELLGEKLTLLQQKESEYRIEFLEKGSKKNLNTLLKQQKTTFKTSICLHFRAVAESGVCGAPLPDLSSMSLIPRPMLPCKDC